MFNRKKYQSKYQKNYYKKNKELINKKHMEHYYNCNHEGKLLRNRQYEMKNKLICLSIYSDNELKCKKCGCDNIDVLEIDHINNNGNIERRNGLNSKIWKSLQKNNYPEGYQVLCRNCNWLKRLGVA